MPIPQHADQGTRTPANSQLVGEEVRIRPPGLTTSNFALYLAANSSDGQYHHRRSHRPCPLGSVQSRTKQFSRPTGTSTVSYFSTTTLACQPLSAGPALVRCTALPTCSGNRVVRTSMFAWTIGEAALKAPRNRSTCCPPLTFAKRQNGPGAPGSAWMLLESVKV